MVDEAASLGIHQEVVGRKKICTKERVGDVSDEEDPVEVLPQPEGERQHALAVGLDAAGVRCLQGQASGASGAVGGRGR